MTLNLHNNTLIGTTLKSTLDEMISKNLIHQSDYDKVYEKFKQVMLRDLEASKVNNKTTIKAALDTYNNSDMVWRFDLKGVSVNTDREQIKCDRLKIVAVEQILPGAAKNAKSSKKTTKKPRKK